MRRIALAICHRDDESEKNPFAREVVARLHVVLAAELQTISSCYGRLHRDSARRSLGN
jgi:hypothetical protein